MGVTISKRDKVTHEENTNDKVQVASDKGHGARDTGQGTRGKGHEVEA